eukprot:7384484-Prymnesium_polylepis.1
MTPSTPASRMLRSRNRSGQPPGGTRRPHRCSGRVVAGHASASATKGAPPAVRATDSVQPS